MTEQKLYEHTTDGGAVYLTTKEHDLSTAVVRLDGGAVLLKRSDPTAIVGYTDRILELAEHYNDFTTSDVQGIADAIVLDIIRGR